VNVLDITNALFTVCEFCCFYVQVKSVCEERLTLVSSSSAVSEPADTSATHRNSPVSETVNAELSTTDVQTDCVTRNYYEVSFREITSCSEGMKRKLCAMLSIEKAVLDELTYALSLPVGE